MKIIISLLFSKRMPWIVRVYTAVCNFQSMKSPMELNRIAFSQNSYVISPGLLYYLISRNTGRLAKRPLRQILLSHRFIFQSLYNSALISAKWEIDETVSFRNFRKLFTNKFAALYAAFWHTIFKLKKWNEVAGYMKHAAMVITCTLHWGS